jgi:methionyl-tRNA synthetase
MPDQPQKFYLTTPIYYVNARPHIGHAYTTIVADVLARRHRLLGDDTFFLTGTDEHGQKIERSAAAAGIEPQQFADEVSAQFRSLWDRMGLTYDRYIRTTSPEHIRGAQHLFTELHKRGFIYLSSYTGQYSIGEEMFVEGPPGTIGPDGKPTETVTEENFFFKLSAFEQPLLDLIESDTLKITPESAKNEVLSFIRGGLRDLSVSRSSFTWGIPVPEPAASETQQKHVIYVWLDALANYMTAIGYGAPGFEAPDSEFNHYWPADLHLVGKEITRFHCVYWPAFLMAAGLPTPKAITANGWLLFDNAKMSKSRGNVVRTETILDAFGTLCPPIHMSPAELAHTPNELVILSETKDLLSFEPPQPPTAGTERKGTASAVPMVAPPNTALAAEVRPPTPHERDLFAADILRYHLLREIPFGQDGSFSFDAMITRYNADLANGYGNLVSRTLNLIQTNFPQGFGHVYAARFSSVTVADGLQSVLTGQWYVGESSDGPYEQEVEVTLEEDVARRLADNDFFTALREISSFIRQIDGHMSANEPWKLAKSTDPGARVALESVLYTAAESIRIITALLYPILPYATARVWAQLGLGDIEQAAANGDLKNLQWGGLKPGTKLGPLALIFPRADKGLAQIMIDMENPETQNSINSPLTTGRNPSRSISSSLVAEQKTSTTDPAAPPRTASLDEPSTTLPVAGSHAHTTGPDPTLPTGEPAPAPTDVSPQITIDDFIKIDLRVAQITLAERIPKADKLLRLEVDLGPLGTRQILSGIAEFYTPEELTGRRIVVIANLAPRKMRGLESHGMLLAASDTDHGKPHLATCGEDIPLGSRLK